MPDGAPGELCLGGEGLARGYRNDAALTAQKFPVHPELGRLYRCRLFYGNGTARLVRESAWRDQLKYLVGRAFIWAKKTFRGYQPRVGF